MASKELIEKVGRYIDKYYKPENEKGATNQKRQSILDKVTDFRKKHGRKS